MWLMLMVVTFFFIYMFWSKEVIAETFGCLTQVNSFFVIIDLILRGWFLVQWQGCSTVS